MKEKKKDEGSLFFIIFILLGIALLIYFQVYKKDVVYYLKKGYQAAIESDYSGIVVNKIVEHDNHNNSVVIFSNKNKISMNGYFWGKVQIGDSISKVQGDSVIQIFRNGHRIILEIAPFYESAIEKEKNR